MNDNVVKFKPKPKQKTPRKLSRLQRKLLIVLAVCVAFGGVYLFNRLTGRS